MTTKAKQPTFQYQRRDRGDGSISIATRNEIVNRYGEAPVRELEHDPGNWHTLGRFADYRAEP